MKKIKLLKDFRQFKAGDFFVEITVAGVSRFPMYELEGAVAGFPFLEKEVIDVLLELGFAEEVKKERWKPFLGDIIYAVNMDLSVDEFVLYSRKDKAVECGNYFRIKSQAEEASRRIKKVLEEYQEELLNA